VGQEITSEDIVTALVNLGQTLSPSDDQSVTLAIEDLTEALRSVTRSRDMPFTDLGGQEVTLMQALGEIARGVHRIAEALERRESDA
jgi:hypothetical protein